MLVADVGNTRIKWGDCDDRAVVRSVAVAPDDPDAWREQLDRWQLTAGQSWAIAGVHPARRDGLAEWLRQRGDRVRIISHYSELPLSVRVERPDSVGIDRLLNVLAARSRVCMCTCPTRRTWSMRPRRSRWR